MNFLELVQRLHSDVGETGTAPSTVTGQTGMALRLVNWTKKAYEDVQEVHESWLFRRDDFDFPTIATQPTYTPAAVSIDDLANWVYDPDQNALSGITCYSAVTDEQHLVYMPWDDFKRAYYFGAHRSVSHRPTVFTIKPDMSIQLWAIPDAVYTITGEYIKQPVAFVNNADTPVFTQQHMIIVFRAMMYYGHYQGAPEIYAFGQDEYKKALSKLEFNQLPKMTFGSSLV